MTRKRRSQRIPPAALALAACAVLASWMAAAASASNRIVVDIQGFRNEKGQALCDLFSSAQGFPANWEMAASRTAAPVSNRRAVCTFLGVEPGRYAVSVIHDENMNGKLDRIMGMPSEGVGASRDAHGHFGPPKFDDAVFTYSGAELVVPVGMTYLL